MVLNNLITCKGCRIAKKPIEFQSTRREDDSRYVYPKCKLCYSPNTLHRGFAVTLKKCVYCEHLKQPCDYDGTRDTCRKCVTSLEVAARKAARAAELVADESSCDSEFSGGGDGGKGDGDNDDNYADDSFCDMAEDDEVEVVEIMHARPTVKPSVRSRSCLSDDEGKHDGPPDEPLIKKSKHSCGNARDLGRSYRMG